MNDEVLAKYYDARAPEYDLIYQKPRQHRDYERLRLWLQHEVRGTKTLEVACGTGRWTEVAGSAAELVVATDINESVLQIARRRISNQSVRFIRADAYSLPSFPFRFSCGMAHSWLSHVPKQRLSLFVNQFSGRLQPGSKLLFSDGKYVAGYGKPFSMRDDYGNTFQMRSVPNAKFEIIKNFLSRQELFALFAPLCGNSIHYEEWDYLWALKAHLQ